MYVRRKAGAVAFEQLMAKAGVAINGDRDWDIRIRDQRLPQRVLAQGSLGFGESYMDAWWECRAIDELSYRIMRANVGDQICSASTFLHVLHAKLFNLQAMSRAFEVGRRHYDIGNTLFQHMLDRYMIYSCGYWKDADDLDAAQEAKLDLVCRKLMLEPGMKVLDIGCGWGGALKFAAERYGVEGIGITISREQAQYARKLCQGLPIEIRLEDYRMTQGAFDRILSIGMLEHVGAKNYDTYFSKVRELLGEDGLFLLHTIGGNDSVSCIDPWIAKYIFPNAMLPSVTQLSQASEGKLVMEDWHNFGTDYDRTLMSWHARFSDAWEYLKAEYDDTFYRMWRFYLLSCAGVFRARKAHVWQVLYSPSGISGGCRVAR